MEVVKPLLCSFEISPPSRLLNTEVAVKGCRGANDGIWSVEKGVGDLAWEYASSRNKEQDGIPDGEEGWN